MKKGDIVVIDDGSWSRIIKNGKLSYGLSSDRYKASEKNYARKRYVIIETGCSFSNTGSSNTFNNTIIQAVDSDKIAFIEERFLCLAAKPIREVTMADVCRQFGEEVKIKKD